MCIYRFCKISQISNIGFFKNHESAICGGYWDFDFKLIRSFFGLLTLLIFPYGPCFKERVAAISVSTTNYGALLGTNAGFP